MCRMRFERNFLENGNLNCFGLGLSLRNENKLFLILKKIYTEDSSRPSTHCLTRFPHNICMLIMRQADNIVKTGLLTTYLSWRNNDWCKVLSHDITFDSSPSNLVLMFHTVGSPSNKKFLEKSFTV